MRILRTSVCALAVLGLAGSVSADTVRPLVILSAEISATGTTLFVSGENFGRSPEVSLGGIALAGVVVDASGTELTANMPALRPGSYLLEMSRGYWWEQWLPGRMAVAVGAMGRQGETGSKGEKGDPGTAGATGDKGTDGAKGDSGAPGAKGDSGAPGAKGDAGAPGAKGDNGAKGDPGAPGNPGPTALAGQTCPLGVALRGFSASGGLVCDFSRVTQLFCNRDCSPAGVSGCDQADADLLCKLKTGNPNALAGRFAIGIAGEEPGFSGSSCPGTGTTVPDMIGVNAPIFYAESLAASLGAGWSVTDVVCTTP